MSFSFSLSFSLSSLLSSFPFPSTPQESFTRIPRDSISVASTKNDPAMGAATLEVGLNNPILEAGFEIICSPTSSPGSLEAVRKTLQVCQVELHPFFVYGYDGKGPLNHQVSVCVCVCVCVCVHECDTCTCTCTLYNSEYVKCGLDVRTYCMCVIMASFPGPLYSFQ